MSVKRNATRLYLAAYRDNRASVHRSGDSVLEDGNPIIDSNRAECRDRANDVTSDSILIIAFDRRVP